MDAKFVDLFVFQNIWGCANVTHVNQVTLWGTFRGSYSYDSTFVIENVVIILHVHMTLSTGVNSSKPLSRGHENINPLEMQLRLNTKRSILQVLELD